MHSAGRRTAQDPAIRKLGIRCAGGKQAQSRRDRPGARRRRGGRHRGVCGRKNLIGPFYQPPAVLTDTDPLSSLPDRELSAGLAEVIKYGCIWDPLLIDWLEHNIGKLRARYVDALTYAISRSC